MLAIAVLAILHRPTLVTLASHLLLHPLLLLSVGLMAHGFLASDRPPPARLTEFYLWVAFGGVLGGVFNALIAPLVFDRILEYPLVIAMAGFVLPAGALRSRARRLWSTWQWALVSESWPWPPQPSCNRPCRMASRRSL